MLSLNIGDDMRIIMIILDVYINIIVLYALRCFMYDHHFLTSFQAHESSIQLRYLYMREHLPVEFYVMTFRPPLTNTHRQTHTSFYIVICLST